MHFDRKWLYKEFPLRGLSWFIGFYWVHHVEMLGGTELPLSQGVSHILWLEWYAESPHDDGESNPKAANIQSRTHDPQALQRDELRNRPRTCERKASPGVS